MLGSCGEEIAMETYILLMIAGGVWVAAVLMTSLVKIERHLSEIARALKENAGSGRSGEEG